MLVLKELVGVGCGAGAAGSGVWTGEVIAGLADEAGAESGGTSSMVDGAESRLDPWLRSG